jgi:hypothetical protein
MLIVVLEMKHVEYEIREKAAYWAKFAETGRGVLQP